MLAAIGGAGAALVSTLCCAGPLIAVTCPEAKSSIPKDVLGVMFSVPDTIVTEPRLPADWSTGMF